MPGVRRLTTDESLRVQSRSRDCVRAGWFGSVGCEGEPLACFRLSSGARDLLLLPDRRFLSTTLSRERRIIHSSFEAFAPEVLT